jgi:hypothetical protein
MTTLVPAVEDAVRAIRTSFPDAAVEVAPDGGGGGFVVVDHVDLGPHYS